MSSNARSELNALLQRLTPRGQPPLSPSVNYSQLGDQHVCLLTLPALPALPTVGCNHPRRPGDGSVTADLSFTGTGRKRKAAQEEASAAAVSYLKSISAPNDNPVISGNNSAPESLASVIQDLLSEEAILKDVQLRSYIRNYPADLLPDEPCVILPASVLIGCKPIRKWLKHQCANPPVHAGLDPAVNAAHLRQNLLTLHHTSEQGADSAFRVVHDGWALECTRVPEQLSPRGTHCATLVNEDPAQLATDCVAVLVPACSSKAASEVTIHITPKQLPSGALASVLAGPGAPAFKLLLHGRVAKRGVTSLRAPMLALRPINAGAWKEQNTLVGNEEELTLQRPFMYGYVQDGSVEAMPQGGARNTRASWLAGYSVYGPVVLSDIWLDERTAALHVGQYGLTDMQRHVGAMLPEGEYVSSLHEFAAACVCRLPRNYCGAQLWVGHHPRQLLDIYITAHLDEKAKQLVKVSAAQHDAPNDGGCNAAGPGAGHDHVEPSRSVSGSADGRTAFIACARAPAWPGDEITTTSTIAQSADDAMEQAALQLLHQLQQRVMSIFEVSSHMAGQTDANVASSTHALLLQVAATFAADTAAQDVQGSQELQTACSGTFQLLLGADVHGVHPAVAAMLGPNPSVGDDVSSSVALPCCRYDPLSSALGTLPHMQCRLSLQVLKRTSASGPHSLRNQALFSPPLAIQRYQQVAEIINATSASKILDFGCGSGRMLGHLLSLQLQGQLPSVTCLNGCDISVGEVKAAKRFLSGLYSKQGDLNDNEKPPVLQGLQVDVFLHDLLDPDAPLPEWAMDLDLITLVEVVEHLDPPPLAAIAPLLLQRLAPRMVLITTPNVEYNPVLAHLGGGLLPNGMRNSDHRFEWSRIQFTSWLSELCEAAGYKVMQGFGMGQAVDETTALVQLGLPANSNIGQASQGAVLQRRQSGW